MVSKTSLKKDRFDLLSQEILNQGATYFSLILLNDEKNVLYYKSTNEKWHEKYVVNEYYKHCHLISRTNELIKNIDTPFTLCWDLVQCDNEIAVEIDSLRAENKIAHGVSFCNQAFHLDSQRVTFLITLAGRVCDVNFATNVIKHKKEVMDSIIGSNILRNCLTTRD